MKTTFVILKKAFGNQLFNIRDFQTICAQIVGALDKNLQHSSVCQGEKSWK